MPDEDILYHYTDANGLIGIVGKRELWATNILHLNDSSEFTHALDMATEQLRSEEYSTSKWDTKAFSELLKDSESLLQMGPDLPFVFSLSRNGDQLSQWRAYCPKGNGFSIGFRRSQLKYLNDESGFRLVRCVYRDHEKQKLIRHTARFVDRIYRMPIGFRTSIEHAAALRRAYERSWLRLAALKHPGFVEESEWRLVGFPGNGTPVAYRPGRFGILPYCRLPLAPEDAPFEFEHIYVGPNSAPSVAGASLWGLLRDMCGQPIDPFQIRLSSIPLRY